MSDEQLKVRKALKKLLGSGCDRFTDHDVDKLVRGGYLDEEDLVGASRESLYRLDLPGARVDQLMRAQGAAASPGAGDVVAGGRTLQALEQVTEDLKKVASDLRSSSSASQSASKISGSRLEELRRALRVVLAPVPGEPTLTSLLQAQGEADAAMPDFDGRDEVMEDRQSGAVMTQIKENISRLRPQSSSQRAQVQWYSARGITITHRFGQMPYSIKGKNDEVLCVASFGNQPVGAVLGVELKKKLSWQGVRQAETEFYVWQSSSQYPFCQVNTDMKIGCAYYVEGVNPDGHLVLRVRTFGSMEPLYVFMAGLINGLPPDLDDQLRPRAAPGTLVSFPQELSVPQRIKPPPRAERSGSVPPFHAALKLIAEMRDAEDDVANLRDVEDDVTNFRDVVDWPGYYS